MKVEYGLESGWQLELPETITALKLVGLLLLVSACGGGGGGGSGGESATSSPTPPIPVLSLSSSENEVQVDTEFVLTWSSSDATSCSATGDWSGEKALSGDEPVIETVAGNKTYSLSCSGAGGEQSVSVNVEITPAPDLTVSRTTYQITLVESRTITMGVNS